MPDLVQYYIVDNCLGMRKGKVGAQCAHGALLAHQIYERMRTINSREYGSPQTQTMAAQYQKWLNGDMTKIVLKGDSGHVLLAAQEFGRLAAIVVDKGYTDIDPGSKTVAVLPLMNKEDAPDWVKELQLL